MSNYRDAQNCEVRGAVISRSNHLGFLFKEVFMERKFISLQVSKLEFNMIISALEAMSHHYEDLNYADLAKELKETEE